MIAILVILEFEEKETLETLQTRAMTFYRLTRNPLFWASNPIQRLVAIVNVFIGETVREETWGT